MMKLLMKRKLMNIWKDLNPLSQLFKKDSSLSKDLDALQTALKSNDPASAQNAFKALIKDMQSATKTHKHQRNHHRRVENDGDADDRAKKASSTGSPTVAITGVTTSDSSVGSSLDATA